MSKKITLGIQSPEGQKRVSILGSSKLEELYKEVQKAFGLPSTGFLLSQDQRKELKIENSKLRTVTQAKLKHGDRLFMHNSAELFQSTNSNSSSTTSPSVPSVIVVEDPLDVELGKQTGKLRFLDRRAQPVNIESHRSFLLYLLLCSWSNRDDRKTIRIYLF